jgi:hypothetical protein
MALPRRTSLLVTEDGISDRCDDCPVVADRAVLNSPKAQPKRLHRGRRNPDRREQVALATADDHVST